RIIDADAAADLTVDTQINGVLDSGNKTAVYRFSATAGENFYFQSGLFQGSGGTYATWRLIDPYGRAEGTEYSANNDRDTFSVQRTGDYLLLLEGGNNNNAPVSEQF